MKLFAGFAHEVIVKHALFIIALVVVILIALRLFFWALGNVLLLAVAAIVIYAGIQLLLGNRRTTRGRGNSGKYRS